MPSSILAQVRWWGAARAALVALLASMAMVPGWSAAARAQADAGPDMRAAFATPQDIAEVIERLRQMKQP